MENSIKILEQIGHECDNYTSYYKYNRSIKKSQKYKDGRIDAANWLSELTSYYILKEKYFLQEILTHIDDQKKRIAILNNVDYKQGLHDQLSEIEKRIRGSRS